MKKIIALCLSLLVLSCSLIVFAADDFVSSPSGQGPSLITGVISNPSCDAHLVITPYAQRNTLDAEALAAIEAAFAQLSATADLSTLNDAFASHVASLGLDGSKLAVSDLFDASYIGCLLHNSHGQYDITLSAANLDKFVGLLHNIGGAWEFVDNATVSNDKTSLSFTVNSLSPFAILVETEDAGEDSSEVDSSEDDSSVADSSESDSSEADSSVIEDDSSAPDQGGNSPETGDNHNYIWLIVAAVAAVVVLVLVFKKRRV